MTGESARPGDDARAAAPASAAARTTAESSGALVTGGELGEEDDGGDVGVDIAAALRFNVDGDDSRGDPVILGDVGGDDGEPCRDLSSPARALK